MGAPGSHPVTVSASVRIARRPPWCSTFSIRPSLIVHDAVAEVVDPAVVRHHDDGPVRLHGHLADQLHHRPARLAASRAAVGSSHTSSRGSWTSARAMATRCCCPPDSCVGVATSAGSPRPTAASSSRGLRHAPCGGPSRRSAAARGVLGGRQRRQQVVLLEHEADVRRRGTGPSARRPSASGSGPSTSTSPPVGVEQPGDDRDERRLAAPGRADEQHQLAVGQVEVDAARGRRSSSSPAPNSLVTPRSATAGRSTWRESRSIVGRSRYAG